MDIELEANMRMRDWINLVETDFQPVKKGSVGPYEYWLAGKMRWEIRKDGKVIAVERDLSSASAKCRRLRQLDLQAHGK